MTLKATFYNPILLLKGLSTRISAYTLQNVLKSWPALGYSRGAPCFNNKSWSKGLGNELYSVKVPDKLSILLIASPAITQVTDKQPIHHRLKFSLCRGVQHCM